MLTPYCFCSAESVSLQIGRRPASRPPLTRLNTPHTLYNPVSGNGRQALQIIPSLSLSYLPSPHIFTLSFFNSLSFHSLFFHSSSLPPSPPSSHNFTFSYFILFLPLPYFYSYFPILSFFFIFFSFSVSSSLPSPTLEECVFSGTATASVSTFLGILSEVCMCVRVCVCVCACVCVCVCVCVCMCVCEECGIKCRVGGSVHGHARGER